MASAAVNSTAGAAEGNKEESDQIKEDPVVADGPEKTAETAASTSKGEPEKQKKSKKRFKLNLRKIFHLKPKKRKGETEETKGIKEETEEPKSQISSSSPGQKSSLPNKSHTIDLPEDRDFDAVTANVSNLSNAPAHHKIAVRPKNRKSAASKKLYGQDTSLSISSSLENSILEEREERDEIPPAPTPPASPVEFKASKTGAELLAQTVLEVEKEVEKGTVQIKEESPKLAKKEESPKLAKKEESPKLAKKEESPKLAKKEESPKLAKKEESPKLAKKGDSPKLVKRDDSPQVSPKLSQKEVSPTVSPEPAIKGGDSPKVSPKVSRKGESPPPVSSKPTKKEDSPRVSPKLAKKESSPRVSPKLAKKESSPRVSPKLAKKGDGSPPISPNILVQHQAGEAKEELAATTVDMGVKAPPREDAGPPSPPPPPSPVAGPPAKVEEHTARAGSPSFPEKLRALRISKKVDEPSPPDSEAGKVAEAPPGAAAERGWQPERTKGTESPSQKVSPPVSPTAHKEEQAVETHQALVETSHVVTVAEVHREPREETATAVAVVGDGKATPPPVKKVFEGDKKVMVVVKEKRSSSPGGEPTSPKVAQKTAAAAGGSPTTGVPPPSPSPLGQSPPVSNGQGPGAELAPKSSAPASKIPVRRQMHGRVRSLQERDPEKEAAPKAHPGTVAKVKQVHERQGEKAGEDAAEKAPAERKISTEELPKVGSVNLARQRFATSRSASGPKPETAPSSDLGRRHTTKAFVPVKVNKCMVCGSTVYALEMVKVEGQLFHKQCQKCTTCQRKLAIGDTMVLEQRIYCKLHGSEVKNQMLARGAEVK